MEVQTTVTGLLLILKKTSKQDVYYARFEVMSIFDLSSMDIKDTRGFDQKLDFSVSGVKNMDFIPKITNHS